MSYILPSYEGLPFCRDQIGCLRLSALGPVGDEDSLGSRGWHRISLLAGWASPVRLGGEGLNLKGQEECWSGGGGSLVSSRDNGELGSEWSQTD